MKEILQRFLYWLFGNWWFDHINGRLDVLRDRVSNLEASNANVLLDACPKDERMTLFYKQGYTYTCMTCGYIYHLSTPHNCGNKSKWGKKFPVVSTPAIYEPNQEAEANQ
jgi:hypothetical protein